MRLPYLNATEQNVGYIKVPVLQCYKYMYTDAPCMRLGEGNDARPSNELLMTTMMPSGAKNKRARIWYLTERAPTDHTKTSHLGALINDEDDNDVAIEYVDVNATFRRARQSSVHSDAEVKSILSTTGRLGDRKGSTSRVQWEHPVAKLQVPTTSAATAKEGSAPAIVTSGTTSGATPEQNQKSPTMKRADSIASDIGEEFTLGYLTTTGCDVDEENESENALTSIYGADPTPPRRKLEAPQRRHSTWRDLTADVDPFSTGGALRRQSHMAGWVSRATAVTSSVVQEVDYIKEAEPTPPTG